jgi:hypothetical protein
MMTAEKPDRNKINLESIELEIDYQAAFDRLENGLRAVIGELRVQKKLTGKTEVAVLDTVRDKEGYELYTITSPRADKAELNYPDGRKFTADFTQKDKPDIYETVLDGDESVMTRPGADAPGCDMLARVTRDLVGATMAGILRDAATSAQVDIAQ